MIPFIPLPTLDCDVDRSHFWLTVPNDRVGGYNTFDVVMTALARRELPAVLRQSGNWDYYRRWADTVVPAALNIQRRGFGHLERGRLRALQKRLGGELEEVEAKLLAGVTLFDEMRDAALAWRAEHLAKDLYDAWAKNAKRKKPLPEPQLTREKQRATGYTSRMRKADEAEASFLNSPKAKAQWLFNELGLKPAPKAHKRPARSVGQHALLHIYRHLRTGDQQHKWVLEDLIHRSKLNTIVTRYIGRNNSSIPFPVGPEDRIYYHLRAYASETLRWACSDPPLHQWVKPIRHVIVPRRGHVFVAADWKQLEMRILAYYSGDREMIAAFEDPTRDPHRENAEMLFPSRFATASEPERLLMRAWAKGAGYETMYGGSGLGTTAKVFCICTRPQCAEDAPPALSITPTERRVAMKRWQAKRPAMWKWREEVREKVVRNGRRWTCPVGGYTRQFFRPADEITTELANYPMQHTAAELMNRAVVKLDELGAPVVFSHHDSLILETTPDKADYWGRVLKEVMETPVPELGGVRFPVDLKVGEDWGQL